MLTDSLLLIESPIQILIVLTIALLVFGPKKLPEIGRQIGGALRELKKAAGDVSRSFTTDYEPDSPPYGSSYNSSGYDRTASYYTPPVEAGSPVDLTDYTIVGVTPAESEPPSAAVDERADVAATDLGDYTLVGALRSIARSSDAESASEPEHGVSS